jgi:hypothetical protein
VGMGESGFAGRGDMLIRIAHRTAKRKRKTACCL